MLQFSYVDVIQSHKTQQPTTRNKKSPTPAFANPDHAERKIIASTRDKGPASVLIASTLPWTLTINRAAPDTLAYIEDH